MEVFRDNSNKKLIREYTYDQYLTLAETGDSIKGNTSSRRNGEVDWEGTETWEECVDLARNGWDVGIQKMQLQDGVLTNTGVIANTGFVGSQVNMSSYLLGLPDTMINYESLEDYNLEAVDVYIPLAFTAGYSSEDNIRYASAVVEYINELQSKYSVKLIGTFMNDFYPWEITDRIVLKEHGQNLVINNLAFAFHTAFWRRVGFAVIERTKECHGGYGSAARWAPKKDSTTKTIHLKPFMDVADQDLDLDKITPKHIRAKFNF